MHRGPGCLLLSVAGQLVCEVPSLPDLHDSSCKIAPLPGLGVGSEAVTESRLTPRLPWACTGTLQGVSQKLPTLMFIHRVFVQRTSQGNTKSPPYVYIICLVIPATGR